MTAERLDKLISDSGLYSRSEARSLIRAGRVDVDGETVRTPERRFARECTVRVDGSTINCAKYRYFRPCMKPPSAAEWISPPMTRPL